MKWLKPHACLGLLIIAWAAGCNAKPDETTYNGVSLRPPGATEVDGALPQNAIYMFENRAFGGKVTRIENVTSQPPGLTERIGGTMPDSMTSLKWDLAPGVVVIFYQNADGTGTQFPIWGRGQLDTVSKWAFNDKVSRWAWYSVGGRSSSSTSLERAMMPPHMARPTTTIPADTIELYGDRDLKGTLKSISPITHHSQLQYHPVGMSDQATSTRWNVPEGVLVVFYDNVDGTGRQWAIWNKGEYETISPWEMNDKISSFAWYRLGEPSSR